MKLKITDLVAILLVVVAFRLPELSSRITPAASPVVAFCVVEETANRPNLTDDQRDTLQEIAKQHLCEVIDQNIVDGTGKSPAALVPFLAAAQGKPLPVLVQKRKSGTITAIPMPPTIEAFKEAIK